MAPDGTAIDLWIGDAADRGRGYGARIMRLAPDRCLVRRWTRISD